MSGLWLVSYIALWVLVIVLVVIVLGLVRQLGLIYLRLGPEQNLLVTEEGLELGSSAPDFRATDVLSGKEVMTTQWLGRPSVLVFTSPGCGPCVELMPHLAEFQQSVNGAINLVLFSQASPQASLEFANTHKLVIPVIADAEGTFSKLYQTRATPFAYRLDKKGIVRRRGIVSKKKDLEALLEDPLLPEPTVKLPESKTSVPETS